MDPVAHCESKHTERTETNFLYPLGGPSVLKSKLEYTALSIFIFYLLGSGFIRPEDIPFFPLELIMFMAQFQNPGMGSMARSSII